MKLGEFWAEIENESKIDIAALKLGWSTHSLTSKDINGVPLSKLWDMLDTLSVSRGEIVLYVVPPTTPGPYRINYDYPQLVKDRKSVV